MDVSSLTDEQYHIHLHTSEMVLKPLKQAHYAIDEALNGVLDLAAVVKADREAALLSISSAKYLLGQAELAFGTIADASRA